ncbi:DUF4388 domain-containing protein [Planktothrix sp. FACHB-1355]|uniref:DUF4388 domain-containing protein n=1 Tax=Aerosakkonema funiforme FACHB-1375 TaxID=2949571 RepID=A0A926VHZ3_9CYAN|nr:MULTISPECIES: DUF4388 domain-containing protein [Oscillatoriales]MBD2182969.1 DUF4388 domain-containing protein [Aerosakkonema funiforme FACHB-1375]MBD3559246.1 DUF4388 domain-containing protein [Planktothrix sp. FACHB-1355]
MTLASCIEDFSLAELFRIIEREGKSGRLTLSIPVDFPVSEAQKSYYIWFQQGRIVAAGDRLDGQGLISKIVEKGWLSQRAIQRLQKLSQQEAPLGLTLKAQGALQAEQLNSLFTAQIREICGFFNIHSGKFDFDCRATLPTAEMTGLSIPAMEVALAGLRSLSNWDGFADVIPDSSSAIQSIVSGKPLLPLNSLEWQIWEYADGTLSISSIAKQINQPTVKVQQAAFRLMFAGLLEEIPLFTFTFNSEDCATTEDAGEEFFIHPPETDSKQIELADRSKTYNLFIENLVGFFSKPDLTHKFSGNA